MPVAPEGICNSLNDANWVQTLLNLIAQGVAKFEGSGFTVVLNQSTAPGATDRDKLWRDTDTGIIYEWSGGAWIAPHPEPASGDSRRWWAGTLVALETYDGGSVGAVSTNSGPMWEEDITMRGRSPMGPGAIPDSNPAKTLAIGEEFGEGAHEQDVEEVGPHTHPLTADPSIVTGDTINVVTTGTPSPGLQIGLTGTPSTALSVVANEYASGQQAGNVVHPVLGIFCIKRTGRTNYVGA